MAVSKSQQASVNKYVKANYDRINVTMPKGKKDTIQARAEVYSQSVNAYINAAIDEKMERDTHSGPQEAAGALAGVGVVSLPSDVLEAAQAASEAVGEPVPDFVRRAVNTQAKRDRSSLILGINPVTGTKLEKEA